MACRPQPYRLDPQKQGIPDDLKQNITNADEMFQILFEDLNSLCLEVDALAETTSSASASTSGESCGCPLGPLGRDGDDGESWPLPTPGPPGPPGPAGSGSGGGASMPLWVPEDDIEGPWPSGSVENNLKADPLYCQLYNSAAQTIPTATNTVITFDTEVVDVGGLHSTVANTGRITIPVGGDGLWQFTYYIIWVPSAGATPANLREGFLYRNGAADSGLTITLQDVTGAQYATNTFAVITTAVAGNYFEVVGYQTSGGNLNCGINVQAFANTFAASRLEKR